MPSPTEFNAYVLGLRLSQSVILSNPNNSPLLPRAELISSIQRLTAGYDEFYVIVQPEDGANRHARDLLNSCWTIAQQLPYEESSSSDSGYRACRCELGLLRQILDSMVADTSNGSQSLGSWFRLGFEVADGEWNEPIHPITGERQRQGPSKWVVNRRVGVDRLIGRLGIGRNQLLRRAVENEAGNDLHSELPDFLAVGWAQIEAALHLMAQQRNAGDLQVGRDELDTNLENDSTPEDRSHLEGVQPSWNKLRRELTLRGAVIKQVRSVARAQNVVLVLDSFEELGWSEAIDSPISGADSQQRTLDTVKSLNHNLSGIRFHSAAAGGRILWTPHA
jgi:hypothetical protein